jgi:phage repressor protein C with HTH and peptisase S24 domain
MRTLAERLTWAREQKGLSQAALAKLSGVSQGTIGNLETGIRQTARKILEIASALDVDPIWLANGQGDPAPSGKLAFVHSAPAGTDPADVSSPFATSGPHIRVGDEPDTIPIRLVSLKLRAGFTGFETVPELEDGGVLHVPSKVIEQQNLTPHHLLAIRVRGCSMEPMLYEDDVVVINTVDKEPVSRGIYAVNWNGESCVKQLLHKGSQWLLHSMNSEFEAINVRSGHCEIIGRVVYQPGRVLVGRT